MRIIFGQTLRARPRLKHQPARYLNANSTQQLIQKYGDLPGGLLLESSNALSQKIEKIILNIEKNEVLLLPGKIRYQLPVSVDDFDIILSAILQDERLGVSANGPKTRGYGAVDVNNRVYQTMLAADIFLGRIILGLTLPYKFPEGTRQHHTVETFGGGILVRLRHEGFKITKDLLTPKGMSMELLFHKNPADGNDDMTALKPIDENEVPLAFARNAEMVQKHYGYFRNEPALALVESYAEMAAFARFLKRSGLKKGAIETQRKIVLVDATKKTEPSAQTAQKTIGKTGKNPTQNNSKVAQKANAATEVAKADRAAEIVFWNTVKDTKDPAMLAAYIDQFPTGIFVPLAKIMLKKQQTKPKVSLSGHSNVKPDPPQAQAESLIKAQVSTRPPASEPEEPETIGPTGLTHRQIAANVEALMNGPLSSFILKAHKEEITEVVFSPKGSLIATLASETKGKFIGLWNTVTGKQVAALKGHRDSIADLSFSPDGKRLASASFDSSVRLWDTQNGKKMARIPGYGIFAEAVLFSPEGHILASVGSDALKLLDGVTGRPFVALKGTDLVGFNHNQMVSSQDGKYIAMGSWGDEVRIWNAITGKRLHLLKGHKNSVSWLAFSNDGERLASAGKKTVRLWDVGSGQLIATLKGHTKAINKVAITRDTKLLATASDDKTVRLWNAQTGEKLGVLRGHRNKVNWTAFSSNGKYLASTDYDGKIKFWNVDTQKLIKTIKIPATDWEEAASPDGKVIAIAYGKNVKLWDISTGKELAKLVVNSKNTNKPWGIKFSPDGTTLASFGCGRKTRKGTCTQGQLNLWRTKNPPHLAKR